MRVKATYYIYALVDPRDGVMRYVGITVDSQSRLREHIGDIGVNEAKEAWIAELGRLGLKPAMETLEESDDSDYAAERELYWIQTLLAQGVPLTNIRTGRQGFTAPIIEGWATISGAAALLKAEGYSIYPNKIARLADKGKIRSRSDPLDDRVRLVNLDELRALFASRRRAADQ